MAALGKRWRKLSSHTSETDGPIKAHQDPATPKKRPTDHDSLVSIIYSAFQKCHMDLKLE